MRSFMHEGPSAVCREQLPGAKRRKTKKRKERAGLKTMRC